MIHGYKPNGNVVYGDPVTGKRTEGETRQCIHCQYMWLYVPGSGDRRGFCTSCHGFLCAREVCHFEQQTRLARWFQMTGKVPNCIPFEDWHNRMVDKVAPKLPLDPNLTVTPSGLIVPRDSVCS